MINARGMFAALRSHQAVTVNAAFQRAFLEKTGLATAHGAIALGHLRKFCYAVDSTVKEGEIPHAISIAVREGRRQVWLEIAAMLQLSPQEMAAIDGQYTAIMVEPGQRMMG